MSIVLVIIGLIIGGVLKGQEIIASARQKAIVNQVSAIRSATNTYFDRYRALPGDDLTAHANVSGSIKNGDGNGVVGAAVTGAPSVVFVTADNTSENYEFFNALLASNLLSGSTPTDDHAAYSTATAYGIKALPASPLTGTGFQVIYGEHQGFASGDGSDQTQLWLVLAKNPAGPTSAISPHTLLNIDVSSDDGAPMTGGTRAAFTAGVGGANTCSSATSGAATYAVQDQATCIGVFAVLQ